MTEIRNVENEIGMIVEVCPAVVGSWNAVETERVGFALNLIVRCAWC